MSTQRPGDDEELGEQTQVIARVVHDPSGGRGGGTILKGGDDATKVIFLQDDGSGKIPPVTINHRRAERPPSDFARVVATLAIGLGFHFVVGHGLSTMPSNSAVSYGSILLGLAVLFGLFAIMVDKPKSALPTVFMVFTYVTVTLTVIADVFQWLKPVLAARGLG